MTTATLFSYSYGVPESGRNLPPASGNVRRVVIVGGGTAGWMTALTFARSLLGRGVEITLLESPTVGIIGVGEGSTPWLRGFFDSLGIEEAEWMPACHATYKCGMDSEAPARHLKMRIGRVTQHWNKNCLAVGLSQGFIEPLEATALLFIQHTAAVFVEYLERGDLSEAAVFSWYSIMAGMGVFPDSGDLRPPTPREGRYRMSAIDNLLDRSAANFPDHQVALTRIVPRRTDDTLQIYLW